MISVLLKLVLEVEKDPRLSVHMTLQFLTETLLVLLILSLISLDYSLAVLAFSNVVLLTSIFLI